MMPFSRYVILSTVVFLVSIPVFSQVKDTVVLDSTLDEVIINSRRYTSGLRASDNGEIIMDMCVLDNLPKLFGNADPVRYAQMLPGIQTNSDIRSGLYIQGCHNSHNDISIGGVPIYNATHLLGIFSTFNPSHFSTLELNRNVKTASSANRLGGELIMTSHSSVPDSCSFDLSVGLLSSQGTARLRLGDKTSATVSARVSYINLLYSRWLEMDDFDVKYSFYDVNLTLSHLFNSKHSLTLDCYGGNDKGVFSGKGLFSDFSAWWHNYMAALHYLYDSHNDLQIENTAYFTLYGNNDKMAVQQYSLELPSGIYDFGDKLKLCWKGLTAGVDFTLHTVTPQYVRQNDIRQTTSSGDVTTTTETSLYIDWTPRFGRYFQLDAGLRGTIYGAEKTGFFYSVDPSLSLAYDRQTFRISAQYSTRHQYLFQTGFTNIGLPTEFWFSSSREFRPQYAHSFSLSTTLFFFDRMFSLSADAFYKLLYNQVEYVGSVYALVISDYDIRENVVQGDGRNYGFSVMLNKCSGDWTGWINYSYTRALRTFENQTLNGTFPASYERPHELDMVISYSAGEHWNFGTNVIFASGNPFTAPESLSLINGNVLTRLGDFNSYRLRPYFRMDLSVNYKWKSRHVRENGINLSIYNLTCHKNELSHMVSVEDDHYITYYPVSYLTFMLPSISFFCKF